MYINGLIFKSCYQLSYMVPYFFIYFLALNYYRLKNIKLTHQTREEKKQFPFINQERKRVRCIWYIVYNDQCWWSTVFCTRSDQTTSFVCFFICHIYYDTIFFMKGTYLYFLFIIFPLSLWQYFIVHMCFNFRDTPRAKINLCVTCFKCSRAFMCNYLTIK